MAADVYSYDPTLGLVSGALLLALLAMVLRRMTGARRTPGRRSRPDGEPDYGLLVAVAAVATRADADVLLAVLAEHGVRSTVAAGDPGDASAVQVLVFADDAERARAILALH